MTRSFAKSYSVLLLGSKAGLCCDGMKGKCFKTFFSKGSKDQSFSTTNASFQNQACMFLYVLCRFHKSSYIKFIARSKIKEEIINCFSSTCMCANNTFSERPKLKDLDGPFSEMCLIDKHYLSEVSIKPYMIKLCH